MFYNHLRQMVRAARNKGSTEPRLKITFADGRQIVTDAGQGIDYLWQGKPIAKVENHSGNNGMLADLLNGLIEQ